MKSDPNTKLAKAEADLKRWQARLKRSVNKVFELDRQRRKLQLMLLNPDQPVVGIVKVKVPKAEAQKPDFDIPPGPIPAIVVENVKAGLAVKEEDKPVPAFLDRSDPNIAARMTAARKKAEAEERKKMPVTGRAAEAMLAKLKRKK